LWTTLDLSFTSISDGSIEALLTSPLLSQLTSLDLSHCMISDAGALAIASSPRVAGLRSLKLLDNYPMTARGLAALATSPHLGADLRAVFARAAQPQE
jgi:Leucine-rich repeat (LRR) protein